jgi:hypothetical protein
MNGGLENKLRAALRDTAGEIPADPPPLRLTPERPRRRWLLWAAPLAAAAVVVAVAVGSLTLTEGMPHRTAAAPPSSVTMAPVGPDGIPLYYVALTTRAPATGRPAAPAAQAVVRVTATGRTLATITPPKPFTSFSGVVSAYDDRTFVLVAWGPNHPPAQPTAQGYAPPQRFYLLRINPASPTPAGRASLRALPADWVPANQQVGALSLSPDGTSLAADIGTFLTSRLYVFNLVTGAVRTWSHKDCAHCFPTSGALTFGAEAGSSGLSWTADGKHVAFVGPGGGQVWLLDVTAPGSDLLAHAKPVAGQTGHFQPEWRAAVITPDGRTVVAVQELYANGNPVVAQRLVKFDTATGKLAQTLFTQPVKSGYSEILWTNASGSVLVVSLVTKGNSMGIFHGSTYTPIPWSRTIATAAW